MPLLVRPSTPADLDAVRGIYDHAATQRTGTFELEGPDAAEMSRRRDDALSKGLPWLAAEERGRVLGYAYANHCRPRPAYHLSVEDSVYLHPEAQGRGIGNSANHGSIGVQRALGAGGRAAAPDGTA